MILFRYVNRLKRFIFLFLLSLHASCVWAANYLSWYDREDGLPQATVTALGEDADGYLYIGTQDGLARFDGYEFTVFRAAEQSALADNHIRALLSDDAGNLWIGSDGGLNRIRDGVLSRVDVSFSHSVRALAVDDAGRLWIATFDSGLFVLQVKAEKLVSVSQGQLPEQLTALAWQAPNTLWVGSENQGLHALDVASSAVVSHRPDTSVASLALQAPNTLWIGQNRFGLARMDIAGGQWQDSSHFGRQTIYSLMSDSHGQMWAGSYGEGVLHWQDESDWSRRFQADGEGLGSDLIRALFEDSRGAVWIGTARGLAKFDPHKAAFGHIGYGPGTGGLPHKIVTAVFEDDAERLWIGTYGGGLLLWMTRPGKYDWLEVSMLR